MKVPPEAAFRLARLVDRPEAQAIFLSCTQMATIDVITDIERELGKPVVTSNQACLWACLRRLGIRTPIAGYGHLHEHCLDAIDETAFAARPPARLRA